MRLKFGHQYKIAWIDAFGDASWTDEKELEKLIEWFSKPVEQTLYFITESKHFYLFTSVKPDKERPYGDIHGVPRKWLISIREV